MSVNIHVFRKQLTLFAVVSILATSIPATATAQTNRVAQESSVLYLPTVMGQSGLTQFCAGEYSATLAVRLSGTIADTNTIVRIAFNKPMAESAADPNKLVVVQDETAGSGTQLTVIDATFVDCARTTIQLVTFAQEEIAYRVSATGVEDIFSNALSASGNNANLIASASFRGVSASGKKDDPDDDGLRTKYEAEGWDIVVVHADRSLEQRHVTSNPNDPDSDDDGLDDAEEKVRGLDPGLADLDKDRLPASLEYVNNCSDAAADTDGDGITDLDEVLIGWTVETDRGSLQVFSHCSVEDSDGLTDDEESANMPIACPAGGTVSESNVTDPSSRDTDGDGIFEQDELCGYEVTLRVDGSTITVRTDPTDSDTDDDGARDGVERELGGDPTDSTDRDDFADDDGDRVINAMEATTRTITISAVSATPTLCTSVLSNSWMVRSK